MIGRVSPTIVDMLVSIIVISIPTPPSSSISSSTRETPSSTSLTMSFPSVTSPPSSHIVISVINSHILKSIAKIIVCSPGRVISFQGTFSVHYFTKVFKFQSQEQEQDIWIDNYWHWHPDFTLLLLLQSPTKINMFIV